MAKIKITKTDPPVTANQSEFYKSRGQFDNTADIRDDISFLVGKGGVPNMKDDSSRGQFARLQAIMGQDKARKLMDAIAIHAQRPDVVGFKTPEERIQSFYNIGSSNPDISPYIQKAKAFGYGVIPGFRDSHLLGNMVLSGREKAAPVVAEANPELAKRIMLRVQK